MKKTKQILLFYILIITIFFPSCQKTSSKDFNAMKAQQTLRINNQGDLASLHPHTGLDMQCRTFQKALFEGLTRINREGKPELAACEKVTLSPSQTIYTFTLRPMKWTNGENVTAHHFEKAWKKVLQPTSNCLRSDLMYAIKNAEKVKKGELPLDEIKIQAKDDRTLVVELEHPTPYFLDLISHPLFSPLYDEAADVPSIFNGPFRVASWKHERELILERNLEYWDAKSVRLNQIAVSLVKDANTALLMYEKKELDWIGHPFTLLTQDAISRLERAKDFESKPIAAVYWISLNTESFPLNSANIRKALSIVLNRETIAKQVLQNETPTKSILPAELSFLKEEELYSDGDLKLAQKFFQEGLKELQVAKEDLPKLKLRYSDVPGQKKLAEAIQQRWQEAFDVEVELIGNDWNTFFASLGQRQYQMGGCNWFFVYHDPIYTLNFFRNRKHPYNNAQWENQKYEKLLELADGETNRDLRNQHLRQAELLFLEEMPVIPLFVFNAKHLQSPKLKGMVVNNLGNTDFKWAFLEERSQDIVLAK